MRVAKRNPLVPFKEGTPRRFAMVCTAFLLLDEIDEYIGLGTFPVWKHILDGGSRFSLLTMAGIGMIASSMPALATGGVSILSASISLDSFVPRQCFYATHTR
jgi:hypothetical protein